MIIEIILGLASIIFLIVICNYIGKLIKYFTLDFFMIRRNNTIAERALSGFIFLACLFMLIIICWFIGGLILNTN